MICDALRDVELLTNALYEARALMARQAPVVATAVVLAEAGSGVTVLDRADDVADAVQEYQKGEPK